MTQDLDQFVSSLQEEILARARELYSETAIDHWQAPRNMRVLEKPDGRGHIKGPCGDTVAFFIRVARGKIVEASFVTDGCIPTVVSGSMAVELATDETIEKAAEISQQQILTGLDGLPEEGEHCALLVANALQAAVRDYRDVREATRG